MPRPSRRTATAMLVCLVLCLQACPSAVPARVRASGQAPLVQVALSTDAPGNRFAPGQPVLATVAITNPGDHTRAYTRTETLADYTGAVTWAVTDTLTLAPGATLTVPTPLPIRALGQFSLTVRLTDGVDPTPVAAQLNIGVLWPRPPSSQNADGSPFGVSGTLNGNAGGSATRVASAVAAMAAAGVGYDREEFNWGQIEPVPGSGRFDFARSDAAVIALHGAGIRILGLLAYWGALRQPIPGGADPRCAAVPCAYTPQGLALYVAYVRAVVARYGQGGALAREQGWTDGYGIREWEVWNEPFNPGFWRQDLPGYAGRFVALLAAAYAAIHAIDPAARVLYDHSGPAFDLLVAAHGAPYDVVSVHSYSGGLDPDAARAAAGPGIGAQGTAPTALRRLVTSGSRPVWITETGYATDGTVTATQQAQYLARSYLDAFADGIQKEFWFKLQEDAGGLDGSRFYGLLDGSGAPKPAYLALATLTRHLQGTGFVRTIELGTALHAALFAGGDGRTVAALWSTAGGAEDSAARIVVALPAGVRAEVDDLMDNPYPEAGVAAGPGRQIVVPLSASPAFLTVRGTDAASLATLLQAGRVLGIAPVGVGVAQAAGLSNGLPDLHVTVTARTNVPISGTVALRLPAGWLADRAARPFRGIPPGRSLDVPFHLERVVDHADDVLGAVATVGGSSSSARIPATGYALARGSPPIDGTLAGWGRATRTALDDPRSAWIVGIPGWTPGNVSARVYTMWDDRYFYLAAAVTDQTFDPAPPGAEMYQGDGMQFGWSTDPPAYGHRYNLTVGLTGQGAANFQQNLLAPWADVREAIAPDRATGRLIYTLAIPWARLGGYHPAEGRRIAFDLIVVQNEHHARIGWIGFSPGLALNFRPREYPLWTLVSGNPAAGLRLGWQAAGSRGTLAFALPAAGGRLLVRDGGMRRIDLAINGRSVTLRPGAGLVPFGTGGLDLSRYLRAGTNVVVARGTPAGRGSAAVLSFFQ